MLLYKSFKNFYTTKQKPLAKSKDQNRKKNVKTKQGKIFATHVID